MARTPRGCAVVAALALTGAGVGVARADGAALSKLLARADAVAKEVARVRGLPLKRAVAKDVVDTAALHDRLVKLVAEPKQAALLDAQALELGRWGLIPAGLDYRKLMLDLLTEQVAGYYDPDTRKLTISATAGDDVDWAEMVLAHELDHALQDQSFDLKAFEDVPDSEGDAAAARHALVEGDGVAAMLEVLLARQKLAAPWSDPSAAAAIEQTLDGPSPGAHSLLDTAPLAVREAMVFPYREGLGFVAALRRRQPWSAVDRAFARPPRSTEQILHPDRYVAGEQPIAVTAKVPPALHDYAIGHANTWGELGFDLFLRSHGVATAIAAQAADGWGGDRALVLIHDGDRDPAHAIGLARLDWDTEADALEASDAAGRALADALAGATVTEHTDLRTRWTAADGTAAWVERKGGALILAIGVPADAADATLAQQWSAFVRKR